MMPGRWTPGAVICVLSAAGLCLLATPSSGRPFRPALIPNGTVNSCSNCHIFAGGGGPRTPFGEAVNALVTPGGMQQFWGPALAMADSDGDGFSNGEELQDPTGLWQPGQSDPGVASFVSNPGIASSVPNLGPTPTPGPPLAIDLQLNQVASGFSLPVQVTHAGDGSDRLFVLQQRGRIRIVDSVGSVLPQDFLDLGVSGLNVVSQTGSERGLLGIAFHPDYANNGRFFVHYTREADGDTIISEFAVSGGDPNVANTAETIILGPIPQPETNHNGGTIEFGPEGLLYIALGDGGGGGDDHGVDGNGQNLGVLLGKILRIDIDNPDPGMNYGVPLTNQFASDGDGSTLGEIFAYGLRNPYRFSFDRGTGRLFVGDVGQNRIEEVDIVVNGGNYGWRIQEGTECFNTANFTNPLATCPMADLIQPIDEYPRSVGTTVVGGHVYNGPSFPNMTGLYLFGDFGSGRIFALQEEMGQWSRTEVLDSNVSISSFGEDEAGEIYLCDYVNGLILQLVDLSPTPTPTPTPFDPVIYCETWDEAPLTSGALGIGYLALPGAVSTAATGPVGGAGAAGFWHNTPQSSLRVIDYLLAGDQVLQSQAFRFGGISFTIGNALEADIGPVYVDNFTSLTLEAEVFIGALTPHGIPGDLRTSGTETFSPLTAFNFSIGDRGGVSSSSTFGLPRNWVTNASLTFSLNNDRASVFGFLPPLGISINDGSFGGLVGPGPLSASTFVGPAGMPLQGDVFDPFPVPNFAGQRYLVSATFIKQAFRTTDYTYVIAPMGTDGDVGGVGIVAGAVSASGGGTLAASYPFNQEINEVTLYFQAAWAQSFGSIQGSWVDDLKVRGAGFVQLPPLGAKDWEVFE